MMAKQEPSERYQIPMHILREYESWGLCGAAKEVIGVWQYDDRDLERLSTIMTLHDISFTTEEAEAYMRLLLEHPHTEGQRMKMLVEKRSAVLNEISFKEHKLQRLDCLHHEPRKNKTRKK